MHRYAVQNVDRGWSWVPVLTLAFFGLYVASDKLSALLNFLPYTDFLPYTGFLRGPSVAALMAALSYRIFDKRAWRMRIIRGIVGMPDLRGTYHGFIVLAGGRTKLPVTFMIHQTFSRISIITESGISTASSFAASINIVGNARIELHNVYRVKRKAGAPPDFRDHEGVNRITFDLTPSLAQPSSGAYYTDAGRNTHGDIEWQTRA